MTFTKRILSLLMIIAMVLSFTCLNVSAKTIYTDGDWVYEMIKNETEFEIDQYIGDSADVSTLYSHNNMRITSIGEHAFSKNSTVASIKINAPISSIKSFAFMNCKSLTKVTLNSEVDSIGTAAFSGCTSLSSINLQDSAISSFNYSSFMNCDSLTEVTLPKTVTSINENAFAYCDGLTKITIPASVTEIHEKAFYKAPNVVIYCYENSTAHLYAEENGIEYVLLDPPVTYILGDVDNSGEVSILDATEVQLLIAQLVQPQDEYTQLRADIDCDGVLSIMDATSIQMYIAGYEVDEPIGETFEV